VYSLAFSVDLQYKGQVDFEFGKANEGENIFGVQVCPEYGHVFTVSRDKMQTRAK
jgi:hypothetical protein